MAILAILWPNLANMGLITILGKDVILPANFMLKRVAIPEKAVLLSLIDPLKTKWLFLAMHIAIFGHIMAKFGQI